MLPDEADAAYLWDMLCETFKQLAVKHHKKTRLDP
jgi:hypothetical protein